jgi:geranylgeranyl reductase family protein
VLLVERGSRIGLPVQCAEYVPAQIARYATLPERCVAQRIERMRTVLPDGSAVETPAAGVMIDRAHFDRSLAVAAHRTGVRIWTSARALERTERGVLVRRGGHEVEVVCQVLIGADGPRSTVGRWVEQENRAYLDARQVEVVLSTPRPTTEVYFHRLYRGGYGWLFPKGDTANVGVGVSRAMGGDANEALAHLLDQLEIGQGAVVGRTGGLVPSGGEVASLRVDNVLLAGDAGGATHPITGAGIASAVIAGTFAGEAAGQAACTGNLDALDGYEEQWSYMHSPLRHALERRHFMDDAWSDDPVALSAALRESWIAFKGYGRRQQ